MEILYGSTIIMLYISIPIAILAINQLRYFLCVNRKGLKRGSLEFMKSPHMLRVSMPRWRLCDKQFLPSTSLIPVRHKAVTRQHVCTRTHSLCSLQPEVILPRDLDFPCQFCTYVKLNGETFQLQTAGLRRKILMATSTRRGKCFLCRHVCTYTHTCRQVIQHKSMANSCVIKAMPKKTPVYQGYDGSLLLNQEKKFGRCDSLIP